MADIIESILKKTGGKDRSVRWFRQKVRELGEVPPAQLVREGVVTGRPSYGRMNFFFYDPKQYYQVLLLQKLDQIFLYKDLWHRQNAHFLQRFL